MGKTPPPNPIYTIGYSVHTVTEFIALLNKLDVNAVADVRSQPYSQRHPDFCRESLRLHLERAGLAYVFLGSGLGARSENPACYVNGKINFNLLAREESFLMALERLLSGSKKFRIAIMCAEKDPLACHRAILVSRSLHERGAKVLHIHADGALESHGDLEGRMMRKLKINEQDLFAGPGENRALAYERMGERIAFEEDDKE